MRIIICPGMHEPELTQSFVSGWLEQVGDRTINQETTVELLVSPTEGCLSISAFHILQFLHKHLESRIKSPVIFISFSAGVVGAILAAHTWQLLGGQVKALIAIDGWGVPLWGDFPIHRMSHDYFTHWSSSLLGSGHDNFYADPSVNHLEIWRSPQTVQGCWVDFSSGELALKRLSAAEFLHLVVKRQVLDDVL